MIELSFSQILKHMGQKTILKDVDFQIYANERVGIVGANGTGKTTILKLIAGIEKLKLFPGSWSPGYDYGFISIPKDASIAYLDQIPNYDESLTVFDVLNLAFKEVYELESKMRELETQMAILTGDELEKVLKIYGRISERYEIKGGYEVKEKLAKVCSGLKLSEEFLNKAFDLLSGGEKTTVVLGKILIDKPDILLLDEPTNHLDTESIEWLEEYLQTYKGIVVLVSHDRYFLDNVVNKIIEIEDLGVITYKGNYSEYLKQKDENLRIQFNDFKDQKKKIQAMEKTIRDLRQWAQKADNTKFFKRAASIQIKLDKMIRIKKPVFDRRNMNLSFNDSSRSGKETIKVIDVSKSFLEKEILKNANMMINYGERVALLGSNGSGKTTLIKMLLEEEKADAGEISLGANVKHAYLPQNISFNNEEHTTLECFRDEEVIEEGKAREYLAKFMFYGKSVFTEVKYLSGGERIRLKLAKLLYRDVNLLVLDEPTNHLDIESIETLESALEDFSGTILFISHDRYFINKMANRIVSLDNYKLNSYIGEYSEYRKTVKESVKALVVVEEKKETAIKKTIKKEINIESKIEKLEIEINELERKIDDIDIFMSSITDDYEKLSKLFDEKLLIKEQLDFALSEWEHIQE